MPWDPFQSIPDVKMYMNNLVKIQFGPSFVFVSKSKLVKIGSTCCLKIQFDQNSNWTNLFEDAWIQNYIF